VTLPDSNPGGQLWADLSEDEQERVMRLLRVSSDDNLDDILARCERALQIIRGEKP